MKAFSTKTYQRRRWPKMLILAGSVLLTLIIVSVLVIRRTYEMNLRPISAAPVATQQVNIPTGSTVKQIAKIMEDAKLIRAAWAFEWYVRNNDAYDSLQAGTYPLNSSQSVQEIVSILTNGKVSTDMVTILPGKRLDQIRKTLINYGYDEKSVDAALDPSKYSDHPALVDKPAQASLEGYIYPETFQKNGNTKPEEIIRGSLDEMQKLLTPELRAGIVRQGLTVHQGIILASIIDQEAGSSADMPTIAQVFLKRLNVGMQLGSDVTSIYGAVTDGINLPDNVAKAASIAIAHDSPYNTRMHSGLPPGPISNVSKAALQAVANPSNTGYLYFVAGDPQPEGGPGKTYFANNASEHESNITNYCKVLCSQ